MSCSRIFHPWGTELGLVKETQLLFNSVKYAPDQKLRQHGIHNRVPKAVSGLSGALLAVGNVLAKSKESMYSCKVPSMPPSWLLDNVHDTVKSCKSKKWVPDTIIGTLLL